MTDPFTQRAFWAVLADARFPTVATTMEWQRWLAQPFIDAFVRPTRDRAHALPCAAQSTVRCSGRHVIQHGADDLVAPCGHADLPCLTERVSRTNCMLHRFRVDLLCGQIADELGLIGDRGIEDPPDCWSLGLTPAADASAFLLLRTGGRGEALLRQCTARHGPSCIAVYPSGGATSERPHSLMGMLAVLSHRLTWDSANGRFSLRTRQTSLPGDGSPVQESSPAGDDTGRGYVIYTQEGCRPLSAEELERFDPRSLDVVIDATDYRRGRAFVRRRDRNSITPLTVAETQVLLRLALAERPMTGLELRPTSDEDVDHANRFIERARRKVDVADGNVWGLIKTLRKVGDEPRRFEFDPEPNVEFAILFPANEDF